MTFQNRHFLIVSGLHSEPLAEKLKAELLYSVPGNVDQYQLEMRYGTGSIDIRVMRSGDVDAQTSGNLYGQDVYILQLMHEDPWQSLAAVCVAAQEARRAGARSVSAVVPIWKLGRYARAGEQKSASSSEQLTARMLSGSGVDRLVTLTPTAEMLSDFYPIRVEVPRSADLLEQTVRDYIGRCGLPLVLAYGPESLAEGRAIAQLLGWDIGLVWPQKDGWHIGADFQGRPILITAAHAGRALAELTEWLAAHGSGSICCYVPCIEAPYRFTSTDCPPFPVIVTPDPVPEDAPMQEFIRGLPIDRVLAQWLCRDRLDPPGIN